MCSSSKSKLQERSSSNSSDNHMNGRPVLQPNNSLGLSTNKETSSSSSSSSSSDHQSSTTTRLMKYSCSSAPAAGSIAAARREHAAILQGQRKMRIAHYGRSRTTTTTANMSNSSTKKSDHHHRLIQLHPPPNDNNLVQHEIIKRCTFITPNSDPIYVAYHDHEWGVPVHDDKLLFELLVLTGAQVGSDWTSVLRRRQHFRDAFSNFDAQIVSKYSEKRINFISSQFCIELTQVRGVVDNSKRILEIKNEFGRLDKYLWGFVNNKAIEKAGYKWGHKIPAKTSKSETISKDMIRRGFRLVGPTVIHSFMQAAGLTNDHLITCPRHSQIQPRSSIITPPPPPQ